MMVSWNRPFWNYHRLVFLLAGLILPFLFQNNLYRLFFFNTIIIFAILALGLQLVLGFGGILHLGYAGFFGLGAYTSAILTVRFGWPFIPAFVASIAVAIIGGAIMCPIIRLRDVYFALASFVFGLILELVFNQWSAVTNGPIGFRGIPPASLFGFAFVQPMHYYFLLVTILLGCYYAFFRLLNSPFGTALQAMRGARVCLSNLRREHFDVENKINLDWLRGGRRCRKLARAHERFYQPPLVWVDPDSHDSHDHRCGRDTLTGRGNLGSDSYPLPYRTNQHLGNIQQHHLWHPPPFVYRFSPGRLRGPFQMAHRRSPMVEMGAIEEGGT